MFVKLKSKNSPSQQTLSSPACNAFDFSSAPTCVLANLTSLEERQVEHLVSVLIAWKRLRNNCIWKFKWQKRHFCTNSWQYSAHRDLHKRLVLQLLAQKCLFCHNLNFHKTFLVLTNMTRGWKKSTLYLKMAIILPSGQWYAPSAVNNDAWCWMVLHCIA